MFGGIALLLISSAVAAFMLNRIYVGLRDHELNVRGWVYSRDQTPRKYWFAMMAAGLALLLGLLLLLVAIGGLAGAIG